MSPDPRDRRGRRWWLIPLLAVGVPLSVVVVLVAGFFAWVATTDFPFGDPDEFGFQPLDEKAAARAMELRKVAIPDGFTFADGTAYYVFSGADSYWARYRAPGDFAAASAAVAAANPGFPPLSTLTCGDSYLRSFVEHAQLSCTPGTRLAVTAAYAGDPPRAVSDQPETPTDAESLLLVDAGDGVELLALSNGH